ncbi:unnamed protein product [Sphagnum balticum]
MQADLSRAADEHRGQQQHGPVFTTSLGAQTHGRGQMCAIMNVPVAVLAMCSYHPPGSCVSMADRRARVNSRHDDDAAAAPACRNGDAIKAKRYSRE